MILLDTNVLSALIAGNRDPVVIQWLDREPRISIWTTSISLFEVKYGLNILPEGKRRKTLQDAFQILVVDFLENRVATFDIESALHAAEFSSKRKAMGRPVEIRDIMITGISASIGAKLATRNVRDFEYSGIELVNPWNN